MLILTAEVATLTSDDFMKQKFLYATRVKNAYKETTFKPRCGQMTPAAVCGVLAN